MDTNMTFRMDSEVKAQMAAICDKLGMSTSTAFNIFAKAFVRAQGMPFELTACGIDLVLKRQLRRLFNHLAERIFIPLTLKRLHGLDMG